MTTNLRLFIESLPDPFFSLDQDWRVTSMNEKASRFLSRPSTELIGKVFWREFPAILGTRLETETRRASIERRLIEYEEYYAPLARWLEVRVFPDGEGLGVHYRDITARKSELAQAGLLALHASDLITTHSTDGRLVYRTVSPSSEAVLGFRPEELIGRSAHELIHPDDVTGTVAEPVPNQSGAMRRTYRIRRKEGVYIWVESTITELHGAAGQLTDILVISRDVTERKRTEEHRAALARVATSLAGTHTRQEAVEVILNTVVAAVGAYRGALSLPSSDGQYLEMQGEIGYGPEVRERFARLPLNTSLPVTDALRANRAVYTRKSAIGKTYPDGETLLSATTGALATLPLARGDGNLGALALSFRDELAFDETERAFLEAVVRECAITLERADLAQASREEQERYRILAGVTNDAIWDWEFAGDTISWNDGVYTLFGYGPGEVQPTGAWWRDHIHPDDRERVLAGVQAAFTDALGDWRDEYRFARKDGSYATVIDRGQVLRGEGGVLLRMIGGMTDLSERERHRAEIEALNLSLEARVAQRTEELRQHNQSLQTETDALSIFASFTQAVGSESDLDLLAQLAVDTLVQTFGEGSAVYFNLFGATWNEGIWKAAACAGDLDDETLRLVLGGIATEAFTPGLNLNPVPRFIDDWPGSGVEVSRQTTDYRVTAMYPVLRDGRISGLLSVGLKRMEHWSDRDRAVFHAVGHGLSLASERAFMTHRLLAQTDELRARTSALEGFAELARDLAFETDTQALIRRTQEIVLSMLPRGLTFYYEPDGPLWRVRVQTGSVQNDALQATIDAGLPFEETGNLIVPWRSGEPYYQDAYAPDTDQLADQTEHIGSTATIPIFTHGRPAGVLAVALFGTWSWTATDRVVLNTAAQHLTLALERAGVAGALADQREQLQIANEGLEAFSYSVSHDLRAPVRHIQGFAGLLRQALKQGDPDRVQRSLDVIDSSSVRMNTLIDELLKFARLSQQGLTKREVNLLALVDEVRKEVMLGLEDREQQVIWETGALPTDPPATVRGDPALLRQVLLNLMHNAVKYSGRREQPRVEVGMQQSQSENVVWVKDNGVGFDPKYQEKLFGVFQRLHRADEFEGTGIGLATVRRIVQRHGGQVWAEAQQDQGATFFFSLPRH